MRRKYIATGAGRVIIDYMDMDRKKHWEDIYRDKRPDEVSWTQAVPEMSLRFIRELDLPKSAGIIDVGGGESRLADCLLEEGYSDITVLDISANAIERAKKRLGPKASRVKWLVTDILDFKPAAVYALWHDRATFHFLTGEADIGKYVELVNANAGKYLVIGAFSAAGPLKCSGLKITRYSETSMAAKFAPGFRKLNCRTEEHRTPFDTRQNFIFCSFEKV